MPSSHPVQAETHSPTSNEGEEPGLFNEDASLIGTEESVTMKPEARRGDSAASTVALISVSVFVLSTWAIVIFNDPTSLGWFVLHPPLQSLAIGLFTYGILTLQPTDNPRTKAAGLERHQLFNLLLGLPAIIVGTFAIIHNKNLHDAPHFVTWHGAFGIAAVSWIVVQTVFGSASAWGGGVALGGGAKAKSFWKYHRLSGYILFLLLILTAHLGGAWSTWVTDHTNYPLRVVAYTIAPAAILASIYSRTRLSKMKLR